MAIGFRSYVFFLMAALSLAGPTNAAVRNAPLRASVGECAEAGAANTEYFPKDARLLGAQLPSSKVTEAEAGVTAGTLIKIAYGKNFKVLTEKISKEQYVLTQCGTSEPSDAEVEEVAKLEAGYQRKHFQIPLQSVIADSTVQLAFFQRLGVDDRVALVDSYASGPCFQKALACGATLESKWGGNATIRAAQLDSADVFFTHCGAAGGADENCEILRGQKNAVQFSPTFESGNLHAAEHVKFLAAFFNLEAEAQKAFEATLGSYTSAAAAASELGGAAAASSAPVVAWVSKTTGNPDWGTVDSFTIYHATYRLQLTEAAGGANLDVHKAAKALLDAGTLTEANAVPSNPGAGKVFTMEFSSFSSGEAAGEAFRSVLADVDVVVDETYAPVPQDYKFADFLASYGFGDEKDIASSSFKFVKNKKVLRVDGTVSATSGGLDWFESRVAFPDWAVEGLARGMHGDATKRWKYFRNVAEGEMPEVVTPEMCRKTLPVCDAEAFAEPLPMAATTAGPEQNEEKKEDHDDHEHGGDHDDDHEADSETTTTTTVTTEADDHDEHDHDSDASSATMTAGFAKLGVVSMVYGLSAASLLFLRFDRLVTP